MNITPKEIESLKGVEEAAAYLGISRQALYTKVHQGKVGYFKNSKGSLRFRDEDLDLLKNQNWQYVAPETKEEE